MQQRAAKNALAGREAHGDGATEGLPRNQVEDVADADALLGEVAEHLRVGVRDAHDARSAADVEVGEGRRAAFHEREIRGGDRVAVRVFAGLAELGGYPRFQIRGEDVFQHLGLCVHAIPRDVELLGEVELQQPVVAKDLQSQPLAVGGQRHPPVGHMVGRPSSASS